jgi:hypothetical protein
MHAQITDQPNSVRPEAWQWQPNIQTCREAIMHVVDALDIGAGLQTERRQIL